MKKFISYNIAYIIYTSGIYFVLLLFAMIDKNNDNLSMVNFVDNIIALFISKEIVPITFFLLIVAHFISYLLLIINLFLIVRKRKIILFRTINLIQLLNMPIGIIICMFNIAFYYSDETIEKLK